MKKFTHTEVFAEGFLVCGITKTGAKVKVPILECRAGVVGPTGGGPGYAVFFGLRMERNISGKNPLIFLHEIEKKTQGSFPPRRGLHGVFAGGFKSSPPNYPESILCCRRIA